MPIHKRDRSFQKIINEISIDDVPPEYVQSVSFFLENGDEIIFDREVLDDINEENIFSFIMTTVEQIDEGNNSPVSDLQIIIDYKKLEKKVKSITTDLLEKKDKND